MRGEPRQRACAWPWVPLSCPQTSRQRRAYESLRVLSSPGSSLGTEDLISPQIWDSSCLIPYHACPGSVRRKIPLFAGVQETCDLMPPSALPATSCSERHIRCSKQGLSDDSLQALDGFKPKPYTFQHLLVCKGSLSQELPERVSRSWQEWLVLLRRAL